MEHTKNNKNREFTESLTANVMMTSYEYDGEYEGPRDPQPKLVTKAVRSIAKSWNNEKGRKFMRHMITAFVNLDPEYVTPTVEKTPENGKLKCSIIGIRLASNELLSEWADKISKNASKLDKAPIEIQTISYAIKSEKSDKIISKEALIALHIFVKSMFDANDYEMTMLYRRMVTQYRRDKWQKKIAEKHLYSKQKARPTTMSDMLPDSVKEKLGVK